MPNAFEITVPKVVTLEKLIEHARKEPKRCIYISGPMTGCKDLNFPAFDAVAAELQAARIEFVNPADEAKIKPGQSREYYLRRDIARLAKWCQVIWLLPDWRKSDGAVFELLAAQKFGMRAAEIDAAGHPEIVPSWLSDNVNERG